MRPLSIFSPKRIGPRLMKNRLVALPVYTGYAHPDGTISPMLMRHYAGLAKSGVAMVVVANAAVTADGVVSTYNLRVDRDEFVPGLSKLAQAIKQHGALACLQLNHAGRFAKTDQPLLPSPVDPSNLAFNVASLKDFMNFFPLEKRFGLTAYFLKQTNTWLRAMTVEDRARIVTSFGQAAGRAHEAGFDMVELHGAGGYLICQFLSAFTNRAGPEESNSFEKRTAFPLGVVEEVRKQLPKDYPVGFRLILQEWVPGGIELPEAIAFAELLEKEGVAYLSPSAATYNSMFASEVARKMARPGYLRKNISALTHAVDIPTIISGRITTPALADELFKEGAADLIGLGRPVRTDRDWVIKARQSGKKITTCINCNWCVKRVVLDQGFNCRRWPRMRQERTDLYHKLLSRNYRRLLVASSIDDLALLRQSLPLLLPEKNEQVISIAPTILYLKTKDKKEEFDAACEEFLYGSKGLLEKLGFPGAKFNSLARVGEEPPDRSVTREAGKGHHGVILVCRKREEKWPERLLYKSRRKIVGLVGSGSHRSKVLVPVDMSVSTLLALMFLQQTYLGRADIDLTFVHVLTGSPAPVERRWREVKETVGLAEGLTLRLLPSTGNLAATLLKTARSEKFGTIVMGKRGMSMIKRWLLGSVSAGVLRGLRDKTLFLID